MSSTRTFEIHRDTDISGISGTGIVADGAVFPDGTTVVRWREVQGENYDNGVRATTVVHPNVESVIALHGHGGSSRLVFPDECGCGGIGEPDAPGEHTVHVPDGPCYILNDPHTLSDADLADEHDKARGYDRSRAERAAEARSDIQSDPLFNNALLFGTGHSKGRHLHFEAGRSLNGDPSMYPVSEDPA